MRVNPGYVVFTPDSRFFNSGVSVGFNDVLKEEKQCKAPH